MNLELFQQALLHTFSPHPAERHAAEECLAQYKAQDVNGYYPALVHVAATHQYPREIRQAAAIALKNSIKSSWQAGEQRAALTEPRKPLPPEVAITPDTKALVRQQALSGLIQERDAAVRVLLAEILNLLVVYDYPREWPEILEVIMSAMVSPDVLVMHNGLLALRKLAKKFEYKPRKEREPLEAVMVRTFPSLQQLMHTIVTNNHNTIEAAEVLKLLLKIFWSCTQFTLPTCLDNDTLMTWLQFMCVLLHKPLPEAHEGLEPLGQPTDPEERKRWPWWKVKKWACVIVTRFSQRYGTPRYAQEAHKPFAKLFYAQMGPMLLEPMVNLMCLRAQGKFCTDRVVQLSLEYVNSSLENAPTYKCLKPNLQPLLFQVVFPMLFPRDDDVRLFDQDPIEYIRKGGSCDVEEFYDPKDSALGLIKDAVDKRGGGGSSNKKKKAKAKGGKGSKGGQGEEEEEEGSALLPNLLAFVNKILVDYPQTGDFKAKDAALLVLGTLSDELKKPSRGYLMQLEGLVVTHVMPEFSSPHGLMRARACWMMRHFHDIPYSQPPQAPVLRAAMQSVLHGLCDPALPVRVEAATSIRQLALLEGTEEVFVPHLTALLEQYFKIMNEVGSDEVVQALDMIIERFDRYMVPHAKAMSEQLSRTFFAYASEGDKDDDKALAASQCLDALNTLLQSVRDHKDILAACEADVVPVLALVLGPEGDYYEYLESALDLLTCLTFYTDTISTQLWGLFPFIYQVFDRWAYDYIQNMVSPIDNYVHKATHVFLHGAAPLPTQTTTATATSSTPTTPTANSSSDQPPSPPVRYVDMVLSMAGKVLGDERGDYRDACRALLLLKSMLNSAPKGGLDSCLPTMLHMLVTRLSVQMATTTNNNHEDDAATNGSSVVTTKAALNSRVLKRPPRKLTVTLLETISLCLHSNALGTLQLLESKAWTDTVFHAWFQHFNHFHTRTARRQVVLGLTALLELPPSHLPTCIAANLSLIIARMTPLLEEMVLEDEEQQQQQPQQYEDDEEDDDDDEEDEDEDEEEEVDDDEDYVSKKDENYMKALYRMEKEKEDEDEEGGAQHKSRHGGDDDDDDDDDDDEEEDDDDEEEEDFITSTGLAEVDEVAYFYRVLAHAFQQWPEMVERVQLSLSPDMRLRFQAVFHKGQERASSSSTPTSGSSNKENVVPPPPAPPSTNSSSLLQNHHHHNGMTTTMMTTPLAAAAAAAGLPNNTGGQHSR